MAQQPEAWSPLPADLHVWESGGAGSAERLTEWVTARLAAHRQALDEMLQPVSVKGMEKRTPANTLIYYDRAIAELGLAGSQAGILNSVAADADVRDRAQAEAQRVAEAASSLGLNRAVYKALQAMDLNESSDATRHYVQRTLLSYKLAGVDKSAEMRAHLEALQARATQLALEFSRNIQEGAKTVTVNSTAELDGMPADYVLRHPAGTDGKITLTTDPPDMQPVMTFATNAELRRRMFLAYNTRAYPANQDVLLQLLATRQEIAGILGFRSWADLATADQMMGSAANVRKFLTQLNEASREGASREYAMVLEFAQQRQSDLTTMDASSRAYWYEQFRRSAFNFDSQSVRPYFPYAQVEAGVLATAAKLFGVEFRPVSDTAWHPAVSVFDVFEQARRVGRFYLDMHPREGKDKWFSAAPVVSGVRGGPLPEAALICNFAGGERDGGDSGLMQYSDVITYFHEFGHLMHAILGGQTEWVGLSGFATEGDFIEVPSQMLEEFFRDASLLQSFARHYQTGEVLDKAVIECMKQAAAFGRADWVRSQLYYTTLSLDLHDQAPHEIDLDRITKELYRTLQQWTWIDGNRMYASFGHLTGYSSNYYTYAFDKVIALDFFGQFDPENLLNGAAGDRYKQTVVKQGGSKPGRQLVRDFLGRDEDFAAFSAWLNEEFEGTGAKE